MRYKHEHDVKKAIADAIMSGSEVYVAPDSQKEWVLPSPQRCGTYTQRRTYAELKAQELLERNPFN